MKKVYIASPYTLGDVAQNVRFQIDIADILIEDGFAPYVPLNTHFQHMVHPRRYEQWLALDFEWIKSCDYLLRMGGESSGADREVEFALKSGKRVFYSIDELVSFERSLTK